MINGQRSGTNWFVLRHEQESTAHRKAMQTSLTALQPETPAPIQPAETRPCPGVNLTSEVAQLSGFPLTRVLEDLRIWIQGGCVGLKSPPVPEAQFELLADGGIVLQDRGCQQEPQEILSSSPCCGKCFNICKKVKYPQYVQEYAYKLRLVRLFHLNMSSAPAEEREPVCADLGRLKSCKPEYFMGQSLEQLHSLVRSEVVCLRRDLANSSFNLFRDMQVQWVSARFLAQLKSGPQLQDLASQFVEAAGARDVGLAKMIADGVFEGHDVARALTLALVNRAHRENRGCKRLTSSKIPGVEDHVLAELSFTLGGCPLASRRQPFLCRRLAVVLR